MIPKMAASQLEDTWRQPTQTSPRVSEASTFAGASSETSDTSRKTRMAQKVGQQRRSHFVGPICPNCPGPSVPHHCALVGERETISKGKTVGGKGQGHRGQGKGKDAENLRTELAVFSSEVDTDYHARGILLGRGGENLKHISEETGLRIILEGASTNTLRLVVCGPPPHLPALEMARDLLEFVNEDYNQWTVRRRAAGKRLPQGSRDNFLCSEIEVDTSDIPAELPVRGRILGKGGENFKQISQATGSRLVLEGDDQSRASSDC